MIVETKTPELTVVAPLVQGPLLVMQDIELVHVGGGMGGSCHF